MAGTSGGASASTTAGSPGWATATGVAGPSLNTAATNAPRPTSITTETTTPITNAVRLGGTRNISSIESRRGIDAATGLVSTFGAAVAGAESVAEAMFALGALNWSVCAKCVAGGASALTAGAPNGIVLPIDPGSPRATFSSAITKVLANWFIVVGAGAGAAVAAVVTGVGTGGPSFWAGAACTGANTSRSRTSVLAAARLNASVGGATNCTESECSSVSSRFVPSVTASTGVSTGSVFNVT